MITTLILIAIYLISLLLNLYDIRRLELKNVAALDNLVYFLMVFFPILNNMITVILIIIYSGDWLKENIHLRDSKFDRFLRKLFKN